MKTKRSLLGWLAILALALLSTLNSQLSAAPLGTAFSYQGKLSSGTNAANGVYDFTFALYDAAAGGAQQGSTQTTNAVAVTNGYFNVALDFGNYFDGNARWLEISVRTNGAASYTPLTPRQPLTPSPYALFAPAAGVAASATTAAVAGSVANSAVATTGLQDGAVTAAKIAGGNVVKTLNLLKDDITLAPGANVSLTPSGQTLTLASPTDWHIGGNTGTTAGVNFLGTADNQPLEFKVNGTRAFRLEPNTYAENNTIGGAWVNTVSTGVVGATIGGGGSWNRGGHQIFANYSTIAGGGYGNLIQTNADNSTIGGGASNLILSNAFQSTIGGGLYHRIREDAYDSTIAGGWQNEIQQKANGATIAGGGLNTVQSNANTSTIGGGGSNLIQTNASNSTIAGGVANGIQHDSFSGAIGGGQLNQILPYAGAAVIGGGSANTNGGYYATVPGGYQNAALGTYSFAAGQRAKAVNPGAFVWADSQAADFASTANDQFLIRAGRGVGINKNNPATALDVNGTVTASAFLGDGSGLTGLNAGSLSSGSLSVSLITDNSVPGTKIADNSITSAKLASDAASLAKVTAGRLTDVGNKVVLNAPGPIDTTLFTGLSFQYEPGQGEGAIMSAYNDGYSSLSFWTKSASGQPVTRRMTIDRNGLVTIASNLNVAVSLVVDGLNSNTGAVTPGLTFGLASGEGIASKRDTGGNQYGLDFYTGFARRISLSQAGNLSLYDNSLYLRGQFGDGSFDQNNGLGYRGPSKLFAGAAPDGPVLFGYSGGALGTEQYGTEKVALNWTSAGNVAIGATNAPAAVLDVYGTRNITGTSDGIVNIGISAGAHVTLDNNELHAKNGTANADLYLNDWGGNVHVGQVMHVVNNTGVGIGTASVSTYKLYVNGSAYSTGGWSGSDARWKKNVQPVIGALDKIARLQGVTYDWRRDEFPDREFDDSKQLGFLAQDVEKVVPEAVKTDANGYKAIAYEKLTAVLTEGVKEQQAEIETLKSRNAALERNLAELKALVEKLLPN